jgi:hypothetical protein
LLLAWHWVVVVQLVPQAVPLHRKLPQLLVAPGWHVPPLQVPAPVWVEPEQLAALHTVVLGCSRQAPRPSQPPTRPQVDAAWAGHSPPGSWPSGTGEQVPTLPLRLHAWQLWPQAVSQQTPSTQTPLVHWPAWVQAMPFGRLLRHMFTSQKNPDWQSAAPLHTEAHESPVQTLGAQLRDPPAMQVPAAVQVLAAYSVDPVQRPAAHTVPAA